MSYNYELALIFSVKLAEEKQKSILTEIKKYITAAGGKAEEAKLFGKKKFAYPIKKETEGFYYTILFSGEGKDSAQLINKLKLDESVLRYLILRK